MLSILVVLKAGWTVVLHCQSQWFPRLTSKCWNAWWWVCTNLTTNDSGLCWMASLASCCSKDCANDMILGMVDSVGSAFEWFPCSLADRAYNLGVVGSISLVTPETEMGESTLTLLNRGDGRSNCSWNPLSLSEAASDPRSSSWSSIGLRRTIFCPWPGAGNPVDLRGCFCRKTLQTTISPSLSSSCFPRWYWCITQLVFTFLLFFPSEVLYKTMIFLKPWILPSYT